MAVGKNKGLNKGGKKGGVKKKIVDPFTRKNWYDVKVPCMFTTKVIGKTPVNRTQGVKMESDSLKGRIFEVSLADLQNDNDAERSFRKFYLVVEDIRGRNVYTNFHGMNLTTDKLRGMVKKWQTLIECWVDAKTLDGYLLRVFCIGFTSKEPLSQKKSSYAQRTQVQTIRKKMCEKITADVRNNTLKTFVSMLLPDSIGKEVEAKCRSIFPLHDVYIRKVKVLKRPRIDSRKLEEEFYDCKDDDTDLGKKVEKETYEPPVQESV